MVLGTANLATRYGVTNEEVPAPEVASEIVEAAWVRGFRELDTAPTYGSAEALLAAWAGERPWSVGTKCTALSEFGLRVQVEDSVRALAPLKLHSFSVHDWWRLNRVQASEVVGQLRQLKDSGLVGEIGISVYDVEELELAQEVFPDVDLIQVPANLLDQRFIQSSVLRSFAASGARVLARSVLLQGLLAEPRRFSHISSELANVADIAESQGIDVLTLALALLRENALFHGVVVAANSVQQLHQLADAFDGATNLSKGLIDWKYFASKDLNLIDPRRWREPLDDVT